MDLMTIGAFADRTRLSQKALRLSDQLGLLTPAQIDPNNGYRFYGEDQVDGARLVGLLRRLGMSLAVIADIVAKPSDEAAEAVGRYWANVESVTAERRALVSYIQARLTGADMARYDIKTRNMPERKLLSISRHLHANETDAFFDDAFARLRSAAPGVEGIAGCPFLIFYGEVSDDSDGPMELCRPVAADTNVDSADAVADVQLRSELSHDEVFIRLAMEEMGWPTMLPAVDALEAWIREQRRQPAGALRQLLIADQRIAAPGALVCDLSVPLKGSLVGA
jgi:DNA-binding transcriptional MerR regulator